MPRTVDHIVACHQSADELRMLKPLTYYHDMGSSAAILTRLDEKDRADIVTIEVSDFFHQEHEEHRAAITAAFDEAYQAEFDRFGAAQAERGRVPHPDLAKPIRPLLCTCCGAWTQGRQFHNQDTGYGLCSACVGYVATRCSGEFERNHGIKGIHFAIDMTTESAS